MDQNKTVLALDIGGTKMAAAVVNADGEILHENQVQTRSEKGPDGFIDDIVNLAKPCLNSHHCQTIGIASAGPLDPFRGMLINPTNLKTNQASWGEFPIVSRLKERLGLPIILENDAACAVMGEAWNGLAQGHNSAMVMTLGTGVGVGVKIEKKLLRLRDGLHPEASHIPLNFQDHKALCGCGNYGCIEAYLGGRNFTKYANQQWGLEAKDGKQLLKLYEAGNTGALKAFQFYGEVMAQAINAFAVLFCPEVIVFSGGFSHSSKAFLETAKIHLHSLLKDRRDGTDFFPELKVSEMQEAAGLMGAAKAAMIYPERF